MPQRATAIPIADHSYCGDGIDDPVVRSLREPLDIATAISPLRPTAVTQHFGPAGAGNAVVAGQAACRYSLMGLAYQMDLGLNRSTQHPSPDDERRGVVMAGHMNDRDHEEIWNRHDAGQSLTEISRAAGRPLTTVRGLVLRHGGRRPSEPTVWSDARLGLVEREEISRGLAAGASFRAIAKRLGRSPSTVSREVGANGWDETAIGPWTVRPASEESALGQKRQPAPVRGRRACGVLVA